MPTVIFGHIRGLVRRVKQLECKHSNVTFGMEEVNTSGVGHSEMYELTTKWCRNRGENTSLMRTKRETLSESKLHANWPKQDSSQSVCVCDH